MNLIKYIPKMFRGEDEKAKELLESIHNDTGIWWDNIEAFGERIFADTRFGKCDLLEL